ncbi:MAG TPA: tyrosine-protein phosphatase [Propionibacteriaceae bacterium]|nr:tyrosine-protein phosphatase [Propionibacteriaceae bacterium]
MSQPGWIEIDGVANMRDVGGLPASDGRRVRPRRLIRSDNLQDLSRDAVRWLLEEAELSDVVDLRTGVEVRGEGPGPLTRTHVRIHHLSLYPEGADETGIPNDAEELPWLAERGEIPGYTHEEVLVEHYLRYLRRRPDNVVEALRVISRARGAVIVHCAAGKDRTGTITALALRLVGVGIGDIAADYDATNERLSAVLARLRAKATYEADLAGQDEASQRTPAEAMQRLLTHVETRWGSVENYLGRHGWTGDDTGALRARLLE